MPGAGQPGAIHGQPLPQPHGASAAQHAPAPRIEAEAVSREAPPPAPPRQSAPRTASHAGSKTCSWPMGDPKQPGFHFCGEPAEAGKPYCAHHCHVAYHKKSEAA